MTVNLPTATTLQTRIALLTEAQRDHLFSTMTASWDGVHATDAVWRRAITQAELPLIPAGHRVTAVRVQDTECSRCGGTGHFSFSLMHGTKCFGCGGASGPVATGRQATKLGKAARAALDAWKLENAHVAVTDLQVGDRFLDRDGKARTVTAVEAPRVVGRSRSGSDTEWKDNVQVTIHTQRVTCGMDVHATVQRTFTPDLFAAFVAFASTVPGVVFTTEADPTPEAMAAADSPALGDDVTPVTVDATACACVTPDDSSSWTACALHNGSALATAGGVS